MKIFSFQLTLAYNLSEINTKRQNKNRYSGNLNYILIRNNIQGLLTKRILYKRVTRFSIFVYDGYFLEDR